MNGIINVYKPKDCTSQHVVSVVRKFLHTKSVGHMGTLDPLADGVLPVAIGKSTRLFDYLLDKNKEYVATVAFGFSTDSYDLEGEITQRSDILPSDAELEAACKKLTGDIMQIPPIYSAKCVNGKRSYELARKGVAVELPPKKVTVKSIRVLDKISESEYKIKIVCGGGTYIRAIARDLGLLCGTVATMTSLTRTASGIFRIENSVTAEEFTSAAYKSALLVPSDEVIDYPIIRLDERQTDRLYNGLNDVYEYPDGI